jgi:hypothetical protein
MPRRPANVNQADSQRIMRAFKREKIPFRVTLQPNGAAVFEPAEASDVAALEPEDLAEDL